MTDTLTIKKPDDWHLHLRDGPMLSAVAHYTAAHFARAIIMPNLVPPVVHSQQAMDYKARIQAVLGEDCGFDPLMTLYLTQETEPADVVRGIAQGIVKAVKLYPAGATTNSASGVKDFDKIASVLEVLAEHDTPLCVHGEVTDSDIDIFDREAVFIDRVLDPIRQRHTNLKVIMEHVTTKQGVDYVKAHERRLAATLTTHHLIINRNHLLAGGIKPHYYCLPVAKRESHRLALLRAATSGDRRFFLGTDSAPHLVGDKQSACGCAGIFTAPNTLSCLAYLFEQEQALDKLEAFTSLHGPAFYNLPVNEKTITLVKQDTPLTYPDEIKTANGPVVVFDPGFDLYWRVEAS